MKNVHVSTGHRTRKPISNLLYTFILIITIQFAFTACKKTATDEIVVREKNSLLTEDEHQFLSRAGFDPNKATADKDFIIMENDIVLNRHEINARINACKSGIQADGPGIGTEQYSTGPVVGINNVSQINYFIDASVGNIPFDGADWIAAIRAATQDWTDIPNCRVSFTEVFNRNNANLVFVSDNNLISPACMTGFPTNTFARAVFPAGGNVGPWISINDDGPFTNPDGKRTVMRHEIGHTLGFRHSDMNDRIDGTGAEPINSNNTCVNPLVGGYLLPGTAVRDLNSIMVSGTNGFVLTNFDADDLRAARLLYPDNYAGTPQNVQITSIVHLPPDNYHVYFSMNANNDYCFMNITLEGGPGGGVRVPANSPNGVMTVHDPTPFPVSYRIHARGSNYAGDLTTGATTSLWVPRP